MERETELVFHLMRFLDGVSKGRDFFKQPAKTEPLRSVNSLIIKSHIKDLSARIPVLYN